MSVSMSPRKIERIAGGASFALVVARAGDAGAQQALPPIDRPDDGGAEHQELHVVVRIVPGAEQVVAKLVG
jgi:hypothetical protein